MLTAKSQNINQKKISRHLECLAIKCSSTFDDTYKIMIFFSGNSVITIISESIDVVLYDLGKSWNVKYVPMHKI